MTRLDCRGFGADGDLGLRSFRQRRLGFGTLSLTGPAQDGRQEERGQNNGLDDRPLLPHRAVHAGSSLAAAYL
jgi:hypothetical protein